MALVTARADRGSPLTWIQLGSVAGPDAPVPSAAVRSARLPIVGSGIGSVPAHDIIAELPAIATVLTEKRAGRGGGSRLRAIRVRLEAEIHGEHEGLRLVVGPRLRQPFGGSSRYYPATDRSGEAAAVPRRTTEPAEGFDDFVVSRSTRLLRSAYLLTGDWATAEDLVQASLVKAWSAWSRIEGDPEPYVRRILVNSHASWWRRRWRGEVPTGELPETDRPGATDRVDDRDGLWRALRRLPVRQRTVLVLRYFENLSDAEIADAMGCSVGTVKSQGSRALAKLRLDESLTSEEALP